VKTHHTKTYQCGLCNKKFTDSQNCSEHEKSCKEIQKYPGDQCEYKATPKTNLIQHIASSHQDKEKQKSKYIAKRINCEQCERKFNKMETYEKHKSLEHKSSNNISKIAFQKKIRSSNSRNDLPEKINF